MEWLFCWSQRKEWKIMTKRILFCTNEGSLTVPFLNKKFTLGYGRTTIKATTNHMPLSPNLQGTREEATWLRPRDWLCFESPSARSGSEKQRWNCLLPTSTVSLYILFELWITNPSKSPIYTSLSFSGTNRYQAQIQTGVAMIIHLQGTWRKGRAQSPAMRVPIAGTYRF